MEIKKLANNSLSFIIRRFIEIFGISLVIISLLLFFSFISYSPEDPNFIFPKNTQIKNLLGLNGSIISDLFLQSFGFISFLVPISFFVTGINIAKSKKALLFINNLFYTIIYILVGSIFCSHFYQESFWLSINGNGGFLGSYFQQIFLSSTINPDSKLAYYLLLLITIIFFLFNLKKPLTSF